MEQNTDRMYWTVGIIVLGAIIIGGAAYLFPDFMKQIGEKITDVLTNGPKVVKPVTPVIGG